MVAQSARRRRAKTSSRGRPWNFGLNIGGAGSAARDETRPITEESDDEGGTDSDSATGTSTLSGPSHESLAPEADDSPIFSPEDRSKTPGSSAKRFTFPWDRFKSKTERSSLSEASRANAPKGFHTAAAEGTQIDPSDLPSITQCLDDPPQRQELETKIIGQIGREFGSGAFFYSFDFDLTHSLQQKRRIVTSRHTSHAALADLLDKSTSGEDSLLPQNSAAETLRGLTDDFQEPDVQVPLWRRVDRRFFWNEWLLKDFLDVGLHGFVLPVMQGWVQSSTFTIPIPPNPLDPNKALGSVPIDIVVISRRSRDRAGLRYQRRGIDDDGHVANMVETEMIVRAKVRM